jgi:hypothetical protein
MGLDSIISRSPNKIVLPAADKRALNESGIELCGGMYSDGVTSFRGKVYDMFVLKVTGVSLYEEWLPPETISEMADALAKVDPETIGEQLGLSEYFTPSPGEVRNLQKLFRLCAERGLGIVAWA